MPYGNKKEGINVNARFDLLVQYIEFGDKVLEHVEEMAKDKKYLHPFMVVAKKDGLPCKYYCCAYDCVYSFDGFTDCMDKIFKTFFVFNVPYPKQVRSVYLFLQQYLYRIYTLNDKKESAVIKLINKLDRTRLPCNNI